MSHVIAIANQKGGVGKTTTAINLGASLAVAEKRTLVIDIDPQGNATSGLGIEDRDTRPTIYGVLLGESPLKESVVGGVYFPDLDVVPSTRDLVGAEIGRFENDSSAVRESRGVIPTRTVEHQASSPSRLSAPGSNMLRSRRSVSRR